jgi:hypothetical protein
MINSKLQMKKNVRHQQVLKRKNFLPALILNILLWMMLAVLIYFIDPDSFFAVPAFFILSFTCLLFTFSLLFGNTRRGLFAAVGLTIFLILRYLGIGNLLNLLLIAAIAICIEIYFSRR